MWQYACSRMHFLFVYLTIHMAVDILQAPALVMSVAFTMIHCILYWISVFHGFCSGIVKAAYFCFASFLHVCIFQDQMP